MAHYLTLGPKRGACGHRHQRLLGAARCFQRDARRCAKYGEYSDRVILRIDLEGSHYLTKDEKDEVDRFLN